MLIGGLLLDLFKTKGLVFIGFGVLFSIAMCARLYSVYLFRKQYSPKFKLRRGYYFSFKDFLTRGLKTDFGKFVSFVSLMHLAVYIGSPFVAVYLLKQLELSYIWFTVITLSASVYSLIMMPIWGKFADKYGNRLVLVLCTIFIPFKGVFYCRNISDEVRGRNSE